MTYFSPLMKNVKNISEVLDTFEFDPPAFFKSTEVEEYIRIHFNQKDEPVFNIRSQYSTGYIYIHEKFIKMNDYDEQGNLSPIKFSTEAETEIDMFQLQLMQNYRDITFEDIQNCNKIYEYFSSKV